MEWYVYYYNPNKNVIEKFNIFDNWVFRKDVEELLSKKMTKEEFEKELNSILMCCFWSKCEYEVIINPFIGDENAGKKIDIYSQVKMNWDKFVTYCWNQGNDEQSNWILCSDRMPKLSDDYENEEYREYLVTTDNGHIYKMSYGYAYETDEEPCFHEWDSEMWSCYIPNVVAWMYVPKPYKVGNK